MASRPKTQSRKSAPKQEKHSPMAASRGIVPIGGIIAFLGPMEELGDGWAICQGQTIKDPKSPLDGLTLPNLTDERFLMGVGPRDKIGATGGDNQIRDEGGIAARTITSGHSDSGAGYAQLSGGSGAVYLPGTSHRHTSDIPGIPPHNHGGDNRPRYCSVWYICRIR